LRSFIEGFEVLARDYQHMHRRLRVDVAKGHASFILVYEITRYITRDDPAKQATIFRH
jgi:hypothetical protein